MHRSAISSHKIVLGVFACWGAFATDTGIKGAFRRLCPADMPRFGDVFFPFMSQLITTTVSTRRISTLASSFRVCNRYA